MGDNCCPDVPSTATILHRIASDNSSLEMSVDNGVTWFPDNADPRSQVMSVPPPVPGVTATVCDAADNIVQGLQEAQTLISNTASGQGTLQEITLEVVIAILGFLLLPPIGAALLLTLVIGLVRRFLQMGKENYDAMFTAERWDIVRCAFACALEDDGHLTAAGMSEAKRYIYLHIPGDNHPNQPAQNFVDIINFVGLAGLNLITVTYQPSGANCDDCNCDECGFDYNFRNLPYNWFFNDVKGTWEAGTNGGWKSTYKTKTDINYWIAALEYRFSEPCFEPYFHFEFTITASQYLDARASFDVLLMVDDELVWTENGFNVPTGGVGFHRDTVISSLSGSTPVYGIRFTLFNLNAFVGHVIHQVQLDQSPT